MPPPEPQFIGMEIGGTKLQIVAGDGQGRITRCWRARVDPGRGGAGICEQIIQGIGQIRAGIHPVSMAVGFGGPVDWKTGRICRSHQIDGWENFPLARWLTEQFALPAIVENDSNLAALAEAAGGNADPLFYFNLGSGVGGGLIVRGRIYHGDPPGEAEFGHLRLDRSGATVESRCSGWAVDRRIRELATRRPEGFLARRLDPTDGGEAVHLAAALAHDDPDAVELLRELSDDLALALSHVVHLIHPQAMVLGGGLSLAGEPLRAAIAAALPSYVMPAFAPGPTLTLSRLGEDAVPVGALLLAAKCR